MRAKGLPEKKAKSIDLKEIKLRTPDARKAARLAFRKFREKSIVDIDDIIPLCEILLGQRQWPYTVIAFQWSFRLKKQFEQRHFAVFERWVHQYVSTWGNCDDLCTHSLGYFLWQFPEFASDVIRWTESEKTYVRRASAVAFIYGLRRGDLFEHVFQIAEGLMHDKEDHVLKGYGWMLKEATKHYPDEVFKFVLAWKHKMPRVSLRYAIEKLPAEMKERAMNH